MRYTVIWLPEAQDQLAELWVNANDRRAVARSADHIDLVLADDPETKGIDYFGDWLLTVPPLQVIYRINPDDMLVEVETVW